MKEKSNHHISTCIGCQLANRLIEPIRIIYENQWFCCILDHEPFQEGHTLILPKSHIINWSELNSEQAISLFETIQLIENTIQKTFQPSGITVCQNGGVFNELGHFHVHVVPRNEELSFEHFYSNQAIDNSNLKEKINQTFELMKMQIKA